MNYERLNKLAKEAVKYMNPENDWRFIHADSYTFYNLLPNNNYSSSFPMWKELHHEIFNDIRTSLNDQGLVINNFTLVKATPYTICHPIRSYGGVITLSGDAYGAVRSWNNYTEKEGWSYEKAYRRTEEMAERCMHMHAPHLVRWGDMNAFGFEVSTEKPIFLGDRCMNYYPKEGCMFYYYRVNPPSAPRLDDIKTRAAEFTTETKYV